jgi:hypothetical protein
MEHKWVGAEMSIFKIGTKIQAVLSVAFLLVVSLSSIFALQITYSDTGVTYDVAGIISNSKGHYWAATGANLQAAIWDLNNQSGTVWLPATTINCTAKLQLTNHSSIIGAGMYSTILRNADGSSMTAGLVQARSKHNISFSDMTIDGNAAGAVGQNAIQFDGVKFFTLKNLYCHNLDGNGIWVGNAEGATAISNYGTIENIVVNSMLGASTEAFAFNNVTYTSFDNLKALNIAAVFSTDFHAVTNSTISNIVLDDAGGIKIWGEGAFYCSDITMNNIVIDHSNPTANGLTVTKTNRCSISNVQINESKGIGIDTCSYIQAHNINIQHAADVGLSIIHSNHITIDSANVKNAVSYGFYMHVLNNVSVSKLQIVKPGSYNLVETCNDFSISDSIFESGASYGLLLETSTHFSIDSCKFLYNAVDGIDTTIATCNNYTISTSYFKGNAKAIDIAAADRYFIISNCIADSGDIIDLSGSVNNATSYCNKYDNVASITWT